MVVKGLTLFIVAEYVMDGYFVRALVYQSTCILLTLCLLLIMVHFIVLIVKLENEVRRFPG